MNHNPKLIRHRALNTLALLFVALLGTSLPQVASAQYLTEDFESAFTGTPAAPAGWTQTRVQLLGTTTTSAPNVDGTKEWFRNTYSGAWAVIAFTSSNDPIGAQSGTGALCIEDSYFGSTTTTLGSRRMESPAMNLSTSTSPYVRFYYSYPSTASNANFRVMASNDNGATWKSIMAISGNGAGTGSAWRRISVLIPAAYRVANAKIGFEMTNTWGTMNLFIDNLSVEEFTPATITSAATGNWNAGTTWVGGVVPDANSHVVIAAGHVVSANSLAMRCQNLTVDGTLQYSTTLTTDLLQILG